MPFQESMWSHGEYLQDSSFSRSSQGPNSSPSRGFGLRKYVLRRYDLPHERLKLEKDICDVEDSQKPLIIIAYKV